MPEETEHEFKKFLMSLGDSIVLVADDEIVKVHVHTNHPGQAIEKALTFGALSRMKIDNMREEHQEKLIKDAEKMAKEQAEQEEKEEAAQPPKEVGFISVSVGKGMTEIFKELGVDYLIEGGQTMNPSTEDMLNAIAKVNAKTIYISRTIRILFLLQTRQGILLRIKRSWLCRLRPFRRELLP